MRLACVCRSTGLMFTIAGMGHRTASTSGVGAESTQVSMFSSLEVPIVDSSVLLQISSSLGCLIESLQADVSVPKSALGLSLYSLSQDS